MEHIKFVNFSLDFQNILDFKLVREQWWSAGPFSPQSLGSMLPAEAFGMRKLVFKPLPWQSQYRTPK
jgi:hypothetical protein